VARGLLIAHPCPTVLGNDIDRGVKPTEDVLLHRFKYFFHLMMASEHCNDQNICLFYYYTYYRSLANFYLQKNPDLIGFFKIKPRHPNGLKKTDLGEKKQRWEPWLQHKMHTLSPALLSFLVPGGGVRILIF